MLSLPPTSLCCSSSPRLARPPRTLGLSGGTFREQRALGIYRKMASVESIGACSLDLDVSATDVSEYSSQGRGLSPSVGVLSGNDVLSRLPDISKLTNGHEKREYTEIKLPSYVSISCAINGYTNYSRFCRSRDNSPARTSFRKSGTEPGMPSDPMESIDRTTSRYPRSRSDSDGTVHRVYTESKHVTVGKQLQIPLKSTRLYRTEVTLERDIPDRTPPVTDDRNGENLILAKEVGIMGTKSLVQQRIESLYGKSVGEEIKICGRPGEPRTNGTENSLPPQNGITNGKSHKGSTSPPVFRHLNEDFRKQLQAGVTEERKSSALEIKPPRAAGRSFEKHSPQVPKENGHAPPTDKIGHDECDRVKCRTPPPNLSIASDRSMPEEGEREGYGFLNVVDAQREKIQARSKRLESELRSSPDIPEEVRGKIRVACGKANLLVSQKFEQFKGLCWKNIEESPDVPFYTTASDLAGFWDMVMLQVDDINATFQEIDTMRANDWKEVPTSKPAEMKPRNSHITAVSKSNPNTPKRSAKAVELAKAREEARKQLLAAKKKGRQQQAPRDADIAIFTPASANRE